MDISIIVFAGIVVCGISATPLVFHSARKLFKDYVDYKRRKEDRKKQEAIQETKHSLKDTIENGDLSNLIDAANRLGEDKKKKDL